MKTNIETFKELIAKYESITYKQIVKTKRVIETFERPSGYLVITFLTGSCNSTTCRLCLIGEYLTFNTIGWKCERCVYSIVASFLKPPMMPECISLNEEANDTYNSLKTNSPFGLYVAIKRRVMFMKKILKAYEAKKEV